MRSTEAGARCSARRAGSAVLKFDLDRWNPAYFTRLKAVRRTGAEAGPVVEVAFFNGMYADCWPLMPLYHGNNIQVSGATRPRNAACLPPQPTNQDFLRYQRAYIAKITTELNQYDNVIYGPVRRTFVAGKPDGSICHLC